MERLLSVCGPVFLCVIATAVAACDQRPSSPSTVPVSSTNAPSGAPLTDPFVFESSRDGPGAIYLADGEAGGIRRLVSGGFPDWSRDGRIAFQSYGGRPGGVGIYVVNPDGFGERRIGDGEDPSWSPDGRFLAVSIDGAIYVLDSIGLDGPRLVARPPAGYEVAIQPAWSPNGDRIAYAACSGWIDKWGMGLTCGQIQVTAADGTAPGTPLNTPVHSMAPAWSFDGSHLAFETAGTIYTYENGRSTPTSSQGVKPTWTPDGRVVFSWTRATQGLRLLIADYGPVRQLLPDVGTGARNYSDCCVSVRR